MKQQFEQTSGGLNLSLDTEAVMPQVSSDAVLCSEPALTRTLGARSVTGTFR